VNVSWRFYIDQDRQWRWQQLSMNGVIARESQGAFKDYDACLADAQGEGYIFLPSQTKRMRKANT